MQKRWKPPHVKFLKAPSQKSRPIDSGFIVIDNKTIFCASNTIDRIASEIGIPSPVFITALEGGMVSFSDANAIARWYEIPLTEIVSSKTFKPYRWTPKQPYEVVRLVGGQELWAHSKAVCKNPPCPIHSPSNHHMASWPQNWRSDTLVMERICPHGVGHPDPDQKNGSKVHGCDGCCRVK